VSALPDASVDPDVADDLERFEAIAEACCDRLARNERVRRNLPGEGRVRIDRQLPFLCLYRSPPSVGDVGTQHLVTTEAAYLFASGEPRYHAGLNRLCQQIHGIMQEHFGTFLFVEIWAEPLEGLSQAGSRPLAPAFEVVTAEPESLPSTLEAFTEALARVSVHGRRSTVSVRASSDVCPPRLTPLSHICQERGRGNCFVLGIAVRPVFRESPDGPVFPIILQRLRWQLAAALRQAIARFTGAGAAGKAVHYESLGPSSMVKAARIADQELGEVAESFDFLLQVTPTNSELAWTEFADGGYRQTPVLYYRPLPYHPSVLKRRLFEIEIERIEDPTLSHIFWEKQDEVDRQLTALRDIETPKFLFDSRQLYGAADDELAELAQAILARQPPDTAPQHNSSLEHDPAQRHASEQQSDSAGERICVRDFVQRARDEIDYYYQRYSGFNATVEVRDDIAAGMMVSRDRLLIAESLRLRPERIEPLLHHEIGTHLLTYFNGRSQPLRQLYAGLAGYDELQEGLATLAEHVCGGLTAARLRILAARVIAVRSLTEGDTFPETFARLHEGHRLSTREAFITTLRVHRAGGLTKDVIYLRGLRDVLKYLGAGHDVEPLYVGKIGLHHLPYVQELRRRGIIQAPRLLPRFWDDELARDRLAACRGRSLLELLETNP
jgi:uncharacterized protein (TIGR02421 family)